MTEFFFVCLKKSVCLLFFLLNLNFAMADDSKNTVFHTSGHIQFDHIFWKGDISDDLLSGVSLRSANFFIKGEYDRFFSCFVHFNFLNLKSRNNLSQAYVKYSNKSLNIKFGQIIAPFNLEEATYSNNKIFMENCLLEGVIENSFFGLMVNLNTNFYNITASMIVPELIYSKEKRESNKYSFLFRGIFTPIKNKDFLCFFGVNYKLMKMHPEENSPLGSTMFRDVPSFNMPYSLLASHLSSLPRYYVLGFEFAGIWKILYIQSEITFINALWRDYEDEAYKSWYIQASFLLTGESRIYSSDYCSFLDPMPKYVFGAFEIAFRYSYSNIMNYGPLLSGVSSNDGKKDALVCGINWFVNRNLKLQVNYACEDFTYRLLRSRSISGVGFRVQFLF